MMEGHNDMQYSVLCPEQRETIENQAASIARLRAASEEFVKCIEHEGETFTAYSMAKKALEETE